MDSTILTWNAPNWITVCLMAATGFLILGLGVSTYRRWQG